MHPDDPGPPPNPGQPRTGTGETRPSRIRTGARHAADPVGKGAQRRLRWRPVIWSTSTFATQTVQEGRDMALSVGATEFYSRYGNPTVCNFEEAIAELEGAEAARAFGSGMGAICRGGARPVLQRRPHREPATALRRHPDAVERGLSPHGHRCDLRRRHRHRRRGSRRCVRARR